MVSGPEIVAIRVRPMSISRRVAVRAPATFVDVDDVVALEPAHGPTAVHDRHGVRDPVDERIAV